MRLSVAQGICLDGKRVQPDMNQRGIFTTDAKGRLSFRRVKPRHDPVPFAGPMGRHLGAMHRRPNRAAPIQFIVRAKGHEAAITHVFLPDCPRLGVDAVFGVKDSLIGAFRQTGGGVPPNGRSTGTSPWPEPKADARGRPAPAATP